MCQPRRLDNKTKRDALAEQRGAAVVRLLLHVLLVGPAALARPAQLPQHRHLSRRPGTRVMARRLAGLWWGVGLCSSPPAGATPAPLGADQGTHTAFTRHKPPVPFRPTPTTFKPCERPPNPNPPSCLHSLDLDMFAPCPPPPRSHPIHAATPSAQLIDFFHSSPQPSPIGKKTAIWLTLTLIFYTSPFSKNELSP